MIIPSYPPLPPTSRWSSEQRELAKQKQRMVRWLYTEAMVGSAVIRSATGINTHTSMQSDDVGTYPRWWLTPGEKQAIVAYRDGNHYQHEPPARYNSISDVTMPTAPPINRYKISTWLAFNTLESRRTIENAGGTFWYRRKDGSVNNASGRGHLGNRDELDYMDQRLHRKYAHTGHRGRPVINTLQGKLRLTGEDLKLARTSRNLTQREFANLLGTSPASVCQWERGNARIPNECLLKILNPDTGLTGDDPMKWRRHEQ